MARPGLRCIPPWAYTAALMSKPYEHGTRRFGLAPVIAIAALLLMASSGCGQKGDLYLPDEEPVASKPPPAAPSE